MKRLIAFLAVALLVGLVTTAGAAPVTYTEDFNSGFTVGQPVGNHADWANGPNILATAGVAGSVGWDKSGSPATWTGIEFDWSGAQFNSYTVGMDFKTEAGGNLFDDDRVGFSINNPSTSSSDVMSVQMDPGGSGLNIEGYWDGVGGADKRPSIVNLTGLLSPNAWYRLQAVYTKTAVSNEPIISVDLQGLDGSGNPTGSIASATLDTATLSAGDRPHTKYFSGPISPAYKNYTGSAPADNALAIIDDDTPTPPPPSTGHWNVPGPADWMDEANWQELKLPSADKAYITNGGTAELSSAAPTVTQFDVENDSTLKIMPGAVLTGTSGDCKIGDSDLAGKKGTVIQTGGDVKSAGHVYLGDDANDTGEWVMSGGTLDVGDDFKVGDNGKGTVTQSGGSVTIKDRLYIGKYGTGVGDYTLSGAGSTIAVGGRLYVSDENNSVGTFTIEGGTVTVNDDIYMGDDDQGNGTITMLGGKLSVGDDLKLGDDGTGLFELKGGELVVDGYIAITNKTAPSSGTFEISGGTLTQIGIAADSGNARLTVADEAPGTLRIIGGNATINVSNFEQRGGGTFEAIMDGSGISTINCVGVNGGPSYMDLAGVLNISFADGDPPPLGSYDLIVADSLVGAFDSIASDQPTVSWGYETGSAKFTIQVVPEPSTLVLAAIGLLVGLGICGWRRRML